MVNVSSWFRRDPYRVLRESGVVYSGPFPTTVSVNKSFTSPGYLEVRFSGLTPPQTLSILGSTLENFYADTPGGAIAGVTTFTSVDMLFSTAGATIGGLSVLLLDSAGSPLLFHEVIEERKGAFEKRSLPVAYTNLGAIKQSDATLIKHRGVDVYEHDLVEVMGETYSVIRSEQLRDIGGETYYEIDLKKWGREIGS